MNTTTRLLLSAMMFLQYFIWGAWYVTMGTYLSAALKADGLQIGAAYGALAIAAMISPFFVGMIADRFFPAQRVMGFLHLLGAGTLYYLSGIQNMNIFWWVLLFYTLLYTPTISLANSVAFHQLDDPGKQFPSIRVLGTLGWIVAGLLVGSMAIEATAMPFQIAALASFTLAVFSVILPNTPPKPASDKTGLAEILGLDALVLLKDSNFLVFFLASVLVCIPLSFYYSFTNVFLNEIGVENAAGKMTLGQMSEVLFLLVMPLFFKRLGVKNMILVGMFAWLLRYTFFAFGDAGAGMWMLYAGIILHGICYDFFFVTGQIYADTKAGEKMKSAAQGMMTFATYGLGMFIGTFLSGYWVDKNTMAGAHQWQPTWLFPASITAVILFFFALTFKEKA